MFKSWNIFLFLFLILINLIPPAYAQLPQITSGLSYFTSSQNPDGTWATGTAEVETTAATVSVLETLKLLNQTAGTSYVAGTSWLQIQSPLSVDNIADRIRILNLTDNSINALLPLVDVSRGAWGGDDGYLPNSLDTALVLQVLKATNSPNISVINPALAYLTTIQNSDGGWGDKQGTGSNVYFTAIVSATLQQFPQTTPVATAVSRASAYLLARQNADGGFGFSGSTVYETALSYIALIADGQTGAQQATPLQNAVNYLIATQSTNGSWNDDPYSTALALKALYYSENKPASPPPPPSAGKLSGMVVDSVTWQPVSGASVSLAGNPLISVTSDSLGNFILTDVPPGSQVVNLAKNGFAQVTAAATAIADVTVSLGTIPMISSYSTGTIAGIVTDPSGKPLADVAIAVTGSWSGNTTTGADGSFSFNYVTPGQVSITASKSGFQNITAQGNVYARTTLSFSPRLSTTPPQGTTGTLVGRVIDSYWGLPIDHLPEEKGVTVTLSGGITAEPDPNNRGNFSIQGLAPNTYQVTVGMNGFASQTFRVVITAGGITDLGTIRLISDFSMTLSGKVTDASTGAVIPGAEITISGNNLTGRADFAGTYAIADIPTPGEYTLKASATGYAGKSYTIYSSPWLQTMDIALSPRVTKGSISGTIVDAGTGQPVNNVTLTLANDPNVSAITDTSGTFTIAAVPQGAQRILITRDGYSSRTLTTAVAAGVVNNVGTIPLSITQLPSTIQGTVWDAISNTPFAGVDILSTGTGSLQTVTTADGTYKLENVTPGVVTIAATALTKPGYYGARFTGTLEAGGILVFNPILSTILPTTVNVAIQTDKTAYIKGDTVAIGVTLQNSQAIEYSTALHLKVIGPTGAIVYETSSDQTLIADGASVRDFNFTLSADAKPGAYAILLEVYDANGAMIGVSTRNFGVATSLISITPILPAIFTTGANGLSFKLVNSGNIPVSAGNIYITLKDPNGQVVSTTSQSFTLAIGENKTITSSVALSALKFGTYTLSYIQSDESKTGQAIDIAIANAITITPQFDKPSYRIRETATLSVTLSNSGRFNLDSEAIAVTIAAPNAGYTETKQLAVAPSPQPSPTGGEGIGAANVRFTFPIPESVVAGQHSVSITVTLPSGSTSAKSVQFAVPESSLSLSPLQGAYTAGDTIQPVIINSGGVDTQVQYKLSLYDAKSALIAEKSNTETALAGSSLTLGLAVPPGAIDGPYTLSVQFKDLKTGIEKNIPTPVTINGVKANIQVHTDKETYLVTENITGLSSITNSGTVPIATGNLHMQVVTGPGNQKQKTWTTKADFQTGVRSGVDTYGVNDWIIPDDDFEGTTIDTNKWLPYGTTSIQSGKLVVDTRPSPIASGVSSKWQLEGDFDIQVDFMSNNSAGWVGAQFNAICNNQDWITIGNYADTGYLSQVGIAGVEKASGLGGSYSNSGRFRISRTSNTIFTYYWNGTSWIALNSITSPVMANSARVGLSIYRDAFNPGVTASFDNFKLNSGRIKTENQTVDSVRLLPLNDNFDDGVLNRDRWNLWGRDLSNESNGSFHLISNSQYQSQQLSLKAAITGNFTVTTNYKNFVSPANDLGSFHLLAAPGDTMFYIIRAGGTSQLVKGTSVLNNNYYFGSNVPYSYDNGSFRLRRINNTGYTDYLNGSQWVNIYSDSRMSTDFAGIAIYTLSSIQQPEVKADVDSFYTDAGTYAKSGTINLKYDSGTTNNNWGKLLFNTTQPSGTFIKFRTRTSETEAGLKTAIWSDYLTTSGSAITSPAARWIEVEATLATTNTNVTPLLHDVTVTYEAAPGEILWQTDVPVNLAQSAIADINKTIGTLGVTGKLYLQGTMTSSTAQTVATAEYPFYVEQGNFALLLSTDKKIYKPGETVTITGDVKNLSSVAAAALLLQVKDTGGTVLYTETFDLAANSSHTFSFSTTAGNNGVFGLKGLVMQNGVTIADIDSLYETASPTVSVTLTAPDTVGSEPFTIAVSLNNSGKVEATTSVLVTDDKGEVVANQQVTIPAGETRLLSYSRQITSSTTYTALLTGDLTQTLTKAVAYSAPAFAALSIGSKVVTDKISYNANEQVTLSCKITNQGTNYLTETLSALISVIDSQGKVVYSDTASLTQLASGQTMTINRYWNTAANPIGSYSVRVKVLSGSVTLSTSSATFDIIGSTLSGAGLKGSITPSANPIEYGKDQTLKFGIVNSGNEDVAALAINVLVVDPDTQQVIDSHAWSVALPRNGVVSEQVTIPASLLTLKSYIAVLQASMPTMTGPKTLAGVTFTVKDSIPPVLAVSTLPDNSYTANGVLNITGTVTDNFGVKELIANGTAVQVNGDGSFSAALVLNPGPNAIAIVATDISGNKTSDNRTIILDQSAPILTITAPPDNSKTAVAIMEVNGTVDENATITVKLGGTSLPATVTGNSFSATATLIPGSNTIEVTATDLAGNSSSQKRTVVYDDQKPSLSINMPSQDIQTKQQSIVIKGSASDPYTDVRITITVDGQSYSPALVNGSFEQLISFNAEKSYAIVVTAENEVGTKTIAQRNIIYDVTPPILAINPATTPTNQAMQTVSGTREEGLDVTVACATATVGTVSYPTPASWEVVISDMTPGENRVTATSVDPAANYSSAEAVIVFVNKPPLITIAATPAVIWPPNHKMIPVKLTGGVEANGAVIRSVEISVVDEYGLFNQNHLRFGDTIMLEAWRNGDDMDGRVYTITVVVTDKSGNKTTSSTSVVVPHDMGIKSEVGGENKR